MNHGQAQKTALNEARELKEKDEAKQAKIAELINRLDAAGLSDEGAPEEWTELKNLLLGVESDTAEVASSEVEE